MVWMRVVGGEKELVSPVSLIYDLFCLLRLASRSSCRKHCVADFLKNKWRKTK